MGGLLAARVRAAHHAEVAVLERDALTPEDALRKGAPQGNHILGLLARDREGLELQFPGFTDELIAQGAIAARPRHPDRT